MLYKWLKIAGNILISKTPLTFCTKYETLVAPSKLFFKTAEILHDVFYHYNKQNERWRDQTLKIWIFMNHPNVHHYCLLFWVSSCWIWYFRNFASNMVEYWFQNCPPNVCFSLISNTCGNACCWRYILSLSKHNAKESVITSHVNWVDIIMILIIAFTGWCHSRHC